jgi:hypothetical protein
MAKAAECLALAAQAEDPHLAKCYRELAVAFERLSQWDGHFTALEERVRVALGPSAPERTHGLPATAR